MRVEVDAVATPLRINSLNADTAIGQRSTGGVTLRDDDGSEQYEMGQLVEIIDDAQGDKLVFSGVVDTSEESALEPTDELQHKLALVDWHYLADKRLAMIAYDAGLLVGDVASDLIKQYLYEEGVVGRRDAPIFARASTAYKLDFTSVGSGNPRYESVAHNMLSAQQSTIESASLPDPDFRTALGAGGSISRETSIVWQGGGSLKVISDGLATFQSISINLAKAAYSALATYTFSAWMRSGSGTPTIRFYCQANDQIAGNTSLGSVGNVTLSTTWTRYSFSVTMPADLSPYSIIGMRADTGAGAQALTWYMDGLQIETGSVATDWTLGGFPASSAIRVEQGVTNLYSANQSNVEVDTSGFAAVNSATISRDTTGTPQAGTASLKAICPGSQSGEGFWAMIAAASYTASGVVTLSIWLKANTTVSADIYMWHDSPSASVFGPLTVTLTTSWQRFTLTGTMPGSLSNNYGIRVGTHNTTACTIWADSLQIEKHSYATSWQVGGTPRADETLKLPAQGCVSPTRGTIEFRALIDANCRRQPPSGNGGNLFGIDIGPTAGHGGALNLFHSNNTANWVMNISNTDFPAFSDSFTPDGWHHFGVAWDKASVLVYVDGVLRATQNNPHLSSVFAPFFYIGTNGIGGDYCGTLYRDIRVSSRKRTAAEIAADALTPAFASLDQDACYISTCDGVLAATSHIADGVLLPDVIFNYCSNADALDALTKKAGAYWWQIDAYKQLWVQPFTAISAPWELLTDGNGVTTDARRGSIRVKRAKPLYRNVQYVGGIKGRTSSQVEVKIGDSHATTFTVGYPIAEVPTVEVKIGAGAFAAQTVGIKGVDTGKQWYWNGGDAVITQDTGGVVLTASDQIRITYVGEFPLIVISEDTAEIIGQQTLEGGATSGKVELITQDASLTSSDAAFNEAAALLKKFAQKATSLRFMTKRAGLQPGQLLHVEIPRHHLDDDMLIESVKLTDESGQIIWYDVTALLGPANTSWVQFFGSLARGANGSADVLQVGANTTLVLTADFTATSAGSATFTTTVYACPLFPWTLPVTLC